MDSTGLREYAEGTILENPDEGYRKFLAYQFRRRGLTKPSSVDEWRDFYTD